MNDILVEANFDVEAITFEKFCSVIRKVHWLSYKDLD